MNTSSSKSSTPDTDAENLPLPQIFRVSKLAYFAVPMVALIALVLAGASLVWLGWTLIVPLILAWWIHRIRTEVTEDGLRAVRTFGTTDIEWAAVAGLRFPRWTGVRAVLTDNSTVPLPAITFRDLPRLSAASRGRIPDPYDGAELD